MAHWNRGTRSHSSRCRGSTWCKARHRSNQTSLQFEKGKGGRKPYDQSTTYVFKEEKVDEGSGAFLRTSRTVRRDNETGCSEGSDYLALSLYKEAIQAAKDGKLKVLGAEIVAKEIEDYIARRVSQSKGVTHAGK